MFQNGESDKELAKGMIAWLGRGLMKKEFQIEVSRI